MKRLLFIALLVVFACEDKEEDVYGCTDSAACNFNSDATIYVPNSCMDACADAFITAEPESTPCAASKVLNQSLGKVDLEFRAIPDMYALSPPYPNPATSFTNINYALPNDGEVIISILNNSGTKNCSIVKYPTNGRV